MAPPPYLQGSGFDNPAVVAAAAAAAAAWRWPWRKQDDDLHAPETVEQEDGE